MSKDLYVNTHLLLKLLEESNRIEGITETITNEQVYAARHFLEVPEVTPLELIGLVRMFQPDAEFRNRPGLDVRVGSHMPPPGGPAIESRLAGICWSAKMAVVHPWRTHQDYESLHPFTDGNGRSGRLLWAWQMLNEKIWPGINLGFLHAFYYQTIQLTEEAEKENA
jgi:Fic family protein